jgi:hypothetical protein
MMNIRAMRDDEVALVEFDDFISMNWAMVVIELGFGNNTRLSFRVQWNNFNFTSNCFHSGILSSHPYKKDLV